MQQKKIIARVMVPVRPTQNAKTKMENTNVFARKAIVGMERHVKVEIMFLKCCNACLHLYINLCYSFL